MIYLSNPKTIRIISQIAGIIQILGGMLSIYGLYKSSFNTNYELLNSLIITIPLILLSIISGFSILLNKSLWSVLVLQFNYLLQTVQCGVNGLYFFYGLGPYLGFGFAKSGNEDISFWWDKSEFAFIMIIKIIDDKKSFFLTVNIVAILFIFILLQEYKNRKDNIRKTNVGASL